MQRIKPLLEIGFNSTQYLQCPPFKEGEYTIQGYVSSQLFFKLAFIFRKEDPMSVFVSFPMSILSMKFMECKRSTSLLLTGEVKMIHHTKLPGLGWSGKSESLQNF